MIEEEKCQYITIANLSPVKMYDEPYVNMNHTRTLLSCATLRIEEERSFLYDYNII